MEARKQKEKKKKEKEKKRKKKEKKRMVGQVISRWCTAFPGGTAVEVLLDRL